MKSQNCSSPFNTVATLVAALLVAITMPSVTMAQQTGDEEHSEIRAEIVEGQLVITLSNGQTKTIELKDLNNGMAKGTGLIIETRQELDNGETTTEQRRAMLVGPNGKQHVIFEKGFDAAQQELFGAISGMEWIGNRNVDIERLSLGGRFMIGIDCREVSEAMKAQMDLQNGLVVEGVKEDSAASTAGIRQYDVLVRADNEPLIAIKDLTAVIEKAGEDEVSFNLKLLRRGQEQQVTVTPQQRTDQLTTLTSQFPNTVLQIDGLPEEVMFHRLLPGLIQDSEELHEAGDLQAITREMAELRELVEQLREEIRNK